MSSALRALALLGAGFGGYARGRQMYEDNEARRSEREARDEQRARERKQYEEAEALKVSMRDAAAPRTPQSAEVYQPLNDDEGNAMPANPTTGTYGIDNQFTPTGARVNRFASMGEATNAAQAANAPAAVTARMSDTLMAAGKPMEAAQLRTSARQEKAADMQIREAERLQAQQAMMRDLGRVYRTGGIDGIAEFATKNYDDGSTYKAAPGKDGAFELVQMDADGKETGRFPFQSVDEFVMRVGAEADPTKYVAGKKAEAAAAEKDAEAKRRWEAEFGLREREAGDRSMLRAAQAEAAAARAAALRAGGGSGGGAGSVSLEDFRKFNSDFSAFLPDPKASTDPAEAQALMAQNARATSQAQAMFQANASFGTVLTAPEVRAAMEKAQDPKNVQIRENNGQRFQTVNVNGKVVAVSGALQPQQEQAPTPAQPAPTMRAAAAPAASSPAPTGQRGAQIIGPLTPMSVVVKEAEAGNPQAIAVLKRRQDEIAKASQNLQQVDYGNAGL